MSMRGRVAASIVVTAILTTLAVPVSAKGPGNGGPKEPPGPTSLSAPFTSAVVTDSCRDFDDVFGPDPLDPLPLDDSVACASSGTADASTGTMTSKASLEPVEHVGRGDSFPNSIVRTQYSLRTRVPAMSFSFRFEVESSSAFVSNPASAYASLALFARAAALRCACAAEVSEVLTNSPVPTLTPKTVTLVVELRDPMGRPLPVGDIYLRVHLVPFMVVASPPIQSANTVPAAASASVSGVARLVDITATPLPV